MGPAPEGKAKGGGSGVIDDGGGPWKGGAKVTEGGGRAVDDREGGRELEVKE